MEKRTEIFEKLKEILKLAMSGSDADIDACSESSLLETDLGLSSVGILYTVIAIEETFDIRFDDVGASDFKTVADVIDYIEKKLN